MTELKKIKQIMNVIKEYTPTKGEDISSFHNLLIKNYEIPSYIIANIFFKYLGFNNFGKDEKVWWHTFFTYKGVIFCIHDYKFGTWSINCKYKNEKEIILSNEIAGILKCASNLADEIVKQTCLDDINNKKFWIKNNYHELISLYEYYKHELKNKLKNKNSVRYTDEILYKTIPVVISFYSFLEFFLDVVFAFSCKDMSLKDFRNLSWQERFKLLINVEPGQKINPIYEDLVNIKKNFRNPITHGLGNETGLLVYSEYEGGLIPISYKLYNEKIELSFCSFKEQDSLDILKTFDSFIHFINYTKPYSFYLLYLKEFMHIPIDKEHIDVLKKEMTTKKSFNDYLKTVNRISTMVYNREI